MADPATKAFLAHRTLLFTVAYQLLGEIAEAVGKSPAAVRQIAHRARSHVTARRPREAVSPAATRDALEASRRAVDLVTGRYAVRNPEKLSRLAEARPLRR